MRGAASLLAALALATYGASAIVSLPSFGWATSLEVLAGPDSDWDWVRSFEPHADGFDAEVHLLARGTVRFGDLFLLRSADGQPHVARFAGSAPPPGVTEFRFLVAEAATGVVVAEVDLAAGAVESAPFAVLPDFPGQGPRYVGTLVVTVGPGAPESFHVRWGLEEIAGP